MHWAATVLEVLATQMNSVLAEWAVSRCLRTLGQITVKSLAGRTILSLLLTPVLSLAAGVVAESLVAPALSCPRAGPGQRDQPTAMLAA